MQASTSCHHASRFSTDITDWMPTRATSAASTSRPPMRSTARTAFIHREAVQGICHRDNGPWALTSCRTCYTSGSGVDSGAGAGRALLVGSTASFGGFLSLAGGPRPNLAAWGFPSGHVSSLVVFIWLVELVSHRRLGQGLSVTTGRPAKAERSLSRRERISSLTWPRATERLS